MSKHTQGPWKWDYDEESLPALSEVLVDEQGNKILSIGGDAVEGFYFQVTEENKRLIAAAPVMYEALKEVQRAGDNGDDDDPISCCPICDAWGGEPHGEYCEIGKAIALAEGKEG